MSDELTEYNRQIAEWTHAQQIREQGMRDVPSDEILEGQRLQNLHAAERAEEVKRLENDKKLKAAQLAQAKVEKEANDLRMLQGELRRAYVGSDADFAKDLPSLLKSYREQMAFAALTQARENAKRQVRNIA